MVCLVFHTAYNPGCNKRLNHDLRQLRSSFRRPYTVTGRARRRRHLVDPLNPNLGGCLRAARGSAAACAAAACAAAMEPALGGEDPFHRRKWSKPQ